MADNSSYPLPTPVPTRPNGEWQGLQLPPATSGDPPDPGYVSEAVRQMTLKWAPIDICLGGTEVLRARSRDIIPQEPREDDAAYRRRIFHATLPPFLMRLASQAAGVILRKGIELDGDPYWDEWAKDVNGSGATLNEYARRQLVTALLYGHSSSVVDYDGRSTARNLREERLQARRPYLVPVEPYQILGWRTQTFGASGELSQVRIRERLVVPDGPYGEKVVDQIRVMEPGRYELWRTPERPALYPSPVPTATSWELHERGSTSLDEIPLVTVYSNRLGTLLSAPPLLEVAYLNIAYAQRFCDYHHSIHVGAMPVLTLRGYDPDSEAPLGVSVNTALLLPPDGGAEYVQPTSDAFDSQLKCLSSLEDQISRLGINTLTAQNLTNAAAEARRLDRIDSDSIMAVIAGDLERTIERIFTIASQYVNVPPPTVTIPRDYENRLIDGNQITAYLQLFMQGAISQETLLGILQQGEVLPPNLDVGEEITRTQDFLAEQQAMQRLGAGPDLAFQTPDAGPPSNAGQGESLTSQTLPTPMRPGRNAN